MSTSWVAGTVRARALAQRRIGADAARQLARSGTRSDAVRAVSQTPYGHAVHPADSLAAAQHGVSATLLWQLRVLAGWLPHDGVDVVRLLARGFEIANIDEQLAQDGRGVGDPLYRLGALATAGHRIVGIHAAPVLREALRSTPWGDPGGSSAWEVGVGLRLNWADQVMGPIPEAARWARAATALLLARIAWSDRRVLPPALARRAATVIGPGFVDVVGPTSTQVAAAVEHLPADTRWAFDRVDRPENVWRGEAAWWRRIDRDGFALLREQGFGRGPVVGAVAVLAADAWRARAALASAARHEVVGDSAVEAFDVVA
ncbi:hypothetical protein [Rhodococcus sp. AG1013]|uniref:hypothetical protein n=1 Tax=unclassified Rhodococcus (in: high G+C Gram-positive bacteria) TaxID=192944 RepID=UPI000E0AF3CB|nr:hypothetical protein [Rhodococcus sp. AG1013]RDI23211.1 hypothetical protein DEU38_11275 [Rhodococcus sp. AG1013]